MSKELKKANEEQSDKKENQSKRNIVEEFSSELFVLNPPSLFYISNKEYPLDINSLLSICLEINPPPPQA